MRINRLQSPRVRLSAIPGGLPTRTSIASAKAATKARSLSDRERFAREYHATKLIERLIIQRRTTIALGTLTAMSIVACVLLSIGGGPVLLSALWVVPSGLFGALVSSAAELAQTRAQIGAENAEAGPGHATLHRTTPRDTPD